MNLNFCNTKTPIDGYLDDKGGNKYQLHAFMRGSDLHALWSSGVIKSTVEESDAITARFLKLMAVLTAQKWSAVRAAKQSCQIVSVHGFYQIATKRIAAMAKRAMIFKHHRFSDHAPLIIDCDLKL